MTDTTTPVTEMGIEPLVEHVSRAMRPKLFADYPNSRSLMHEQTRQMARAAIAALSTRTPEAAQGWRDIETAPKDGTPIIIGWHQHGEVRGISRAKWVTAEFWADLEGGEPSDFVAGWFEPNYEDELCANVWMPLPEPPALAQVRHPLEKEG